MVSYDTASHVWQACEHIRQALPPPLLVVHARLAAVLQQRHGVAAQVECETRI
jgi:hypothetical protein